MDTGPAVRARGLGKSYGEVVAVAEVDLDVPAGQVHGLIGPNGAGKTTLLSMLLGLTVPDRGRLEVLGSEVKRALALPDGVSGFADGPGRYPSLTARPNRAAGAAVRREDPGGVGEALEQVGLTDVAGDRVRGFSLGMRQRLGLAAALLTRPRLLVLDEPTNGLDPAGARHVHGLLSRLAHDGTAVVLSSHRMDDLAALCSDVTLLSAGRVVFTGPVAKLEAVAGPLDYRVRTSDLAAARGAAADTPGLRIVDPGDNPGDNPGADPGGDVATLVVRGDPLAVDGFVVRLVREGVSLRELSPVVTPLEVAFLLLTETAGSAVEDDA
ncbi:MAG: transporter [Frankiales bacterium]|nr:transporter [Frankiales bacterium]